MAHLTARGLSRLCVIKLHVQPIFSPRRWNSSPSATDIPQSQGGHTAIGPGHTLERLSGSVQQETRRWPEMIKPFSSFLTDNFQRQHTYLRISITERCNLRCRYCMPEEGVQLTPDTENLTAIEIVHLARLFVHQGVTKIRLTGGEPTIRKNYVDLVRQIGLLRSSGLRELCITTNGLLLHRKLDALVEAGLTNINLSLDTLDPHKFTLMTRRNGFNAVWRSIEKILELKRSGVSLKFKINCVVIKGVNDYEVLPFAELGKSEDIEIRFIEYMPFDGNRWAETKLMSYREMLQRIRTLYPGVHRVISHPNDTSKTYQIPGFVGKIGFVTSMTENFCGTCNRLRITSDGNIKVCLFGNEEFSLRDVLRQQNSGKPLDEAWQQKRTKSAQGDYDIKLLNVIGIAVGRKKKEHAGFDELKDMQNRPMIKIGG